MISFIIPSINRASLKRTLDSIETKKGDEIIVEFDLPPSKDWGNGARNRGMKRAQGDYLAFMDDDDVYVRGHRVIMEKAIRKNPNRPILFKIQYPNGKIIWDKKEIIAGNISTQMILVPNNPNMLYNWQAKRNMADFIFVDKWGWFDDEIVWREEIICKMGHNA